MISFYTIFYQPILNLIFFGVQLSNQHQLWIGVIFAVFVIKVILIPLSIKMAKTQNNIKKIQPQLKEIKKIKDKKAQSEKMLKVYKENKINPLTPILILIIQIPILLSIFFVIKNITMEGFELTGIYNFIQKPDLINTMFFGVDLASPQNLTIATLVLITQYIYIKISAGEVKNIASFQRQIQIIIPIVSSVAAFIFAGMIGFYWLFFNILSIIQEFLILRRIKEKL